MKIFLDNRKYEYELKVLIQQFEDSLIHFFDIIEYSHELTDYMILYQNNDKNQRVVGYGNIAGSDFSFEDFPRDFETTSKNAYKRVVYNGFSQAFTKNLPWGILTGIRPTKLYSEFAKVEPKENQILQFVDAFYVSIEKTEILDKIHKAQEDLLKNHKPKDMSIYISIPFCPSRCSYCTFYSNDIHKKEGLIKPYIESLEREVGETLAQPWAKGRRIDSLYFGGGTPSSLNVEDLRTLLTKMNHLIDFKKINEITFEAGRPDTIDIQKLQLLKEFGIHRISINPQTMVDSTLASIGRNHSSKEIVQSYQLSRQAGFNNINMDLILGLEDEDIQDFSHTLNTILELDPESITIHTLALKKSSELTKVIPFSRMKQQSEVVRDMMELIYKELPAKGYHPYYLYRQKNIMGGLENIGFSKKEKDSLYNIFIIEEYQNILAFGPGSISRFIYPDENRIERVANTKNLEEYIKNTDKFVELKRLEMQNESNTKTKRN